MYMQQEYIPEEKLQEVQRVLYGSNQGHPVQQTTPTDDAAKSADVHDYDLKHYSFLSATEQLRAPRRVKIGLIQNRIVLPTTAPFADQAKARLNSLTTSRSITNCNLVEGTHRRSESAWAR